MTTHDQPLRDLRELAEAATPGPWEYAGDERDCMVLTAVDDRWVANVGNWGRQNAAQGIVPADSESLLRNVFELDVADAAYIAACSPDVILALLDERQAAVDALAVLEADRDAARLSLGKIVTWLDQYHREWFKEYDRHRLGSSATPEPPAREVGRG